MKLSEGVVELEKNFHHPYYVDETTSIRVEDLKYLSPIKKILLVLNLLFRDIS